MRAHVDDLPGRDTTHEVDIVAAGGDAIGRSVRCAYPDGTRVLCVAGTQPRDGRIAREAAVQAWDA